MLTARQRDRLEFLAENRGASGCYAQTASTERTLEALRKLGLVGHYVAPRPFIATRYKITPRGRAALCQE